MAKMKFLNNERICMFGYIIFFIYVSLKILGTEDKFFGYLFIFK